MFCLVIHEFIEVFYQYVMFVFIFCDQQKVHTVFIPFFGHIYGIGLSFLITKNIYIDPILFLDFVDLFDGYWKLNSCVIKLVHKGFISLFYSLWVFILRVQMSYMTPSETFIVFVFHIDQTFCTIPQFLWTSDV